MRWPTDLVAIGAWIVFVPSAGFVAVHLADHLHVAAQRQDRELVRGFAPPEPAAREGRAEADAEGRDVDVAPLGGEEMAQLVNEDDERQAQRRLDDVTTFFEVELQDQERQQGQQHAEDARCWSSVKKPVPPRRRVDLRRRSRQSPAALPCLDRVGRFAVRRLRARLGFIDSGCMPSRLSNAKPPGETTDPERSIRSRSAARCSGDDSRSRGKPGECPETTTPLPETPRRRLRWRHSAPRRRCRRAAPPRNQAPGRETSPRSGC